MTAALGRAKAGQAVPEPSNLSRIKTVLPAGSQFQMACIVPDSVRDSIDAQIVTMRQQAAQNPGMAAVAGFAHLFGGIQNLCVGVKLGNDALVSIAGSLGDEQSASQAGILLETMIVPMIQASMIKEAGGSIPPNLTNMIKVNTRKTALQVELRLTEDQLMQAIPTTAPTAAAGKGR